MLWEDRPDGALGPMRRNSGNPIIPRDLLPRSNSIFNSAVVPFNGAYAGVFRVDDMTRTMNIHAGHSADGTSWQIVEEPIGHGPTIGIAWTTDFKAFTQLDLTSIRPLPSQMSAWGPLGGRTGAATTILTAEATLAEGA